ncbi:MAG: helix-turn-helix domain-containing protein [Deferribacteres bacterium]|nr:helix-turn-helix domain-containing protein [candidate division KSB1 bacterium]MCB9502289.1 helix-turn-helix domain-containing protein [Deferribacteres bacterium]
MKKVIIIIPETAVPASIVDPQYMFFAVNNFFAEAGAQPCFDVQLVGLAKEVKLNFDTVSIRANCTINQVKQADLVIVPALSGDMKIAVARNKAFVSFLREQREGGAEIASLCVGAFLLASTGLLDGKQCSTHWLFANQFASMFPRVQLAADKIITDQGGIYTSGGATSYWNLLLYLVEKYAGREMALKAAKFFLLDMHKSTQLPFTIFRGQKEHNDTEILLVQNYIEDHFMENLTIDFLANKAKLGRRTFERRFKKATTNTIVEYVQRVKVEVAKQALEKGKKTINEVMGEVGYGDIKAFRNVFKKYAGMSPNEYKNKFKVV